MAIILDGNIGVTYPDVTTQNTSAIISGKRPTTRLPAGSVLQVVTSQYITSTTTSSTSFVDVGVSASITPTSSSSRVFVLFQGQAAVNSAGTVLFNLLRDSTNIAQPSSGGSPSSFNVYTGGGNFNWPVDFYWIDSPSTTSSTTYKLQWRLDFGGNGYLGRHVTNTEYNTPYSLTLMEIAG